MATEMTTEQFVAELRGEPAPLTEAERTAFFAAIGLRSGKIPGEVAEALDLPAGDVTITEGGES